MKKILLLLFVISLLFINTFIVSGILSQEIVQDSTSLKIIDIKGGIFSFTIKNTGNETAEVIEWHVDFKDGLMLDKHCSTYKRYNISVEQEITIKLFQAGLVIFEDDRTFFGIGRVNAVITAEGINTNKAVANVSGFVFGPFIFAPEIVD